VKLFRLTSIAVGLSLLAVVVPSASSQSGYHLSKTYKFGAAPAGKEYFDYITVDAPNRRVYLSHGSEVLVVNADTGAVIGKISGLQRDHGIALVNDLGRGFISDGDAGKVVVFDLKTLKTIGSVKAAEDADCIVYDPASKRIFTLNGDAATATAIDPKGQKLIGAVELGGKPEFAAADGNGTLYANLEDKNEVVAIDTQALKVKSRWPVAPAGSPVSMAMDRAHRRLFIGTRDPKMLVVMNADTGKVVQTLPISAGADATVYDPESGNVFVSTREGKIHIFHADSPDLLSPVETVNTEVGAKTMGYDSKTHNLMADTADFGPAPAPTAEKPHPSGAAVLGTLRLLVYSR